MLVGAELVELIYNQVSLFSESLLSLSKDFLGSVDNVEKSILVSLPFVEFSQSHGNGSHVSLIDEKEECLVGM